MHDPAHIDIAILGARPKVIAALLRYFRDLDTAEEAFQEACLRALQTWPHKGPPQDPTAWLIKVGRNAALDAKRRIRSVGPLPEDDALPDARDDRLERPALPGMPLGRGLVGLRGRLRAGRD